MDIEDYEIPDLADYETDVEIEMPEIPPIPPTMLAVMEAGQRRIDKLIERYNRDPPTPMDYGITFSIGSDADDR